MSCVLRLTRDAKLLSELQLSGLDASVPHRSQDGRSVNIPVSRAEFGDLPTQIHDAVKFLQTNHEFLKSCRAEGILDFGVAAGDAAAQTYLFSSELILLAGEVEIALALTIYQVREEGPVG